MINRINSVILSFLFVSCVPNFAYREPSSKVLILEKDRYLYQRIHRKSADNIYGLWDFYIDGNDNLHRQIAKIPKGQKVMVESVKITDDYYGLHVIKMRGSLVYGDTVYKFEGKMTNNEYVIWNSKIDGQ